MLNFKKIAVCAASISCLLLTLNVNVKAETKPYDYTYVISTGNQDVTFTEEDLALVEVTDATENTKDVKVQLFDNNHAIKITGLAYGDKVNVDNAVKSLDTTGTIYYASSVRVTGKNDAAEKDTDSKLPKLVIKGDSDYVVSYGVLTDPVEYTVRYVTADGSVLAPEATFVGNAGDTVVVASRHIDGYVADANNKSVTLKKAAEGEEIQKFEITFTYRSSAGVVNYIYNSETGSTTYIYGDDTTTYVNVPGGNAGGAGAAAPDGGNPAAQNANPADNGAVIEEGETPLTNNDLVNLDEEETPLASADEVMTNYAPIIAGIITGVAAVAMLALILVMKKNKIGPFSEKKDAE